METGWFHQKGCKRTARPDEPAGQRIKASKDYRTVIALPGAAGDK